MNTTFKIGLETEKDRFVRIFEFRYFLHLPDFLLSSKASAPAKRTQRKPHTERKLKPIDPLKKKSKEKLVITTYIAFSKQYFGWPYLQPSSINLTTCGIVAPGLAVNFFFKPVDARKFGYDVTVLRLSVQTLG